MSYAENDIDSDEPMDESDEVMIGPQLLKRATNSTDLTRYVLGYLHNRELWYFKKYIFRYRSAVPSACATARVIETKEINLEEDLKANLSAASLEMTEQPSLEEVLSVDSSEEDISMIALSENPGAEDNEK